MILTETVLPYNLYRNTYPFFCQKHNSTIQIISDQNDEDHNEVYFQCHGVKFFQQNFQNSLRYRNFNAAICIP